MNMKKRILIADDDSSIRNGLKKLLTRADYDVALAVDGSHASVRPRDSDGRLSTTRLLLEDDTIGILHRTSIRV